LDNGWITLNYVVELYKIGIWRGRRIQSWLFGIVLFEELGSQFKRELLSYL